MLQSDQMRQQLAEMGITNLMAYLRTIPEVQATIHAVFPHRYSMPGWAHNPEDLAAQIHAHVNQFGAGNDSIWAVAGRAFRANGSRVYAVEPGLMDALNRTSLYGSDFGTVDWPLYAFAIVFPRGGAPLLDGNELASVIVAHVDHRGARNMILCGSFSDGTAVTDHRSLSSANDAAIDVALPHGGSADDTRIEIGLMTGHVLKIMSYLTARKDAAEGTLKARAKKGKTDLRDWWTPWIVGADYVRSGKHPAGGTHASPSMHWRAGHWRNQAIGPRDEERHKLIWIEPVLVGGKN